MTILRKKKLLIVDEIYYPQLVLQHFLMNAGYKVYVAQNSIEAIRCVSDELPDLILISIRSMDCVGISALKTLKNYLKLRSDIVQTADLPIIILSAFGNAESIYSLKTLGVSAILPKPLNMQELLNTIESCIRMDGKTSIIQKDKRILIFDTEVRTQQFFRSILADEMLYIESVSNELELLEKIKNEGFDLCIINLSSLNSEVTDLPKIITEISDNMYILTVSDPSYEISDVEHEKIQEHFIKPINIETFRNKVDSLLNPQIENERQEEPEQSAHDNEKDGEITQDELNSITEQNTDDNSASFNNASTVSV